MHHNFIIFSSYINHIFVMITAVHDEILTAIFIFLVLDCINYNILLSYSYVAHVKVSHGLSNTAKNVGYRNILL